jgi:uncharacterized protein YkwD
VRSAHSRLPLHVLGHAAALAVITAVAVVAVPSAAGGGLITRVPTLEVRVLRAINDVRVEHGLPTLRASPALATFAEHHSISMAVRGYFAHGTPGGASFGDRFGASLGGYRALGETLAWASPALSAGQALRLWLHSPAHRRTILESDWREVGIGAVHAPAAPGLFAGLNVTVLTADFGRRG